MAARDSIIGPTSRVAGRVTGDGDLEIQGYVEGEVAVSGDVIVDAHGVVGAGVRGRRLVVRGAVRGDLVGEEAISLEDGARVVGDLRAPRIAIAPGALVRGLVDAAGDDSALPRAAARSQTAIRPVSTGAVKSAAATIPRPAAAIAAVPTRTNATKQAASSIETTSSNSHGGDLGRRPPPPVVPALKRARGQIAKRRER